MARTLPRTQLAALVRQGAAERFPHPTPSGAGPRTHSLSDPGLSNIQLFDFYGVPEVRAIVDRIASGVQRVNFRPCLNVEGATGDKCPPLIDDDGELLEGVDPRLAADCADIWAQVTSPSGPQSDIFGAIATSLSVTGDAWQFGYPGTPEMRWDPTGTPMWVGLARSALYEQAGQYVVSVGIDGEVKVPSSPDAEGHGTAIRVWMPDTQRPAMASSWLMSCVRSLQMLSTIYEAAAGSALSRLNAGLIVAPDDQDQPPVPSAALLGDGSTNLHPLGDPVQQVLYDMLADHVEAAAAELDGLSRSVPAVIGLNSAIADKVSWVELSRELDPGLMEFADNLRKRIFRACPLPPEVAEGVSELSGLGGGNVAQEVSLQEYQRAILPPCERIAWANTQFVLRAGLTERGWSDDVIRSVQVGFSAKNLLMPPDRSDIAVKALGLPQPVPLLSDAEARDAMGLGEFAGPDEDEARDHVILSLASANPAYGYLLELLGLPTPPAPTAEDPSEVIDVDDSPELPSDGGTAGGVTLPTPPATRQAAADDIGRRLVDLASRYESELAVLFGAIIDRMAERAQSRVASLARSKGWADLRDTVRTASATAPHLVGAIPAVQAQLEAEGVDDADLFGAALATFAARFQNLTTRYQRRTVETAGADWDDFADDADGYNAAAWALAGTLLIGEARWRFDGRLPLDSPEGSADPFGVPSGIVRRTSAVAGGDDDIDLGDDPARMSSGPLGSIATAALATAALIQAGRTVVAWEWDYRPEIPRNPYPEHVDLHGAVEEGAQPGDFGGEYPGSHRGCECILKPITGLGQRGEGVTWPEP